MKKVMTILLSSLLVLCALLTLTACGGDSKKAATPVTGEVVSAALPDGWTLITSTDMTGTSGADFLCHAEKYELGDPYLQVTKESRNIEAMRAVLEGEDPFGPYDGAVELDNGTWYIADLAAAAVIGEKVCLVRGYECDFGSDQVRAILGSLQWVG